MKKPRITITEMQGLPEFFFNGAALERADGGYIFVIRDQWDHLHGGVLDDDLRLTAPLQSLGMHANIDPRLTRWDGRAYMTTRYYGEWDFWRLELWPLNEQGTLDRHDEPWKHSKFMTVHDWPGYTRRRENNWAPFIASDNELHSVHSYNPHRVLWYDRSCKAVRLVSEGSSVNPPWQIPGLSEMRLNTNPIRLPDGTMLSTFHAKVFSDWNPYYTGFYLFEGKKPYNVLKVSPQHVLGPEHCFGPSPRPVERNAVFPLSLHLKGDALMMVGGARSACNVIIRASLNEVLDSLVSV